MTIPTMKTRGAELTRRQIERIIAAVDELTPRIAPAGWVLLERFPNACVWRRPSLVGGTSQTVIFEVTYYRGEKGEELWAHVSTSYPDRKVTWDELHEVKNLFIGRERLAVQVLPPEAEYVNIHPHVLHVWSRLEGPRLLPDFRGEQRDGRKGI